MKCCLKLEVLSIAIILMVLLLWVNPLLKSRDPDYSYQFVMDDFYDLSSWNPETAAEYHDMEMDIGNMSTDELGYINYRLLNHQFSRVSVGQLPSLPKVDKTLQLRQKDDDRNNPLLFNRKSRTESSFLRRRLSTTIASINRDGSSSQWLQEEEGLTREIEQFFSQQYNRQHHLQKTFHHSHPIQQPQNHDAKNKNLRESAQTSQRDRNVQEQQQQYPNANCTDPNASLPCPPPDLPLLCDKYNGGNFESCYKQCKPSYCCAHDSKSTVLSPSCATTEPNCRNYIPCFIVWWRLADSIGPPVYITALQEDDFFDVDVNYLEEDFANDLEFTNQLFQHHTDDDTKQNTEFFESAENWK